MTKSEMADHIAHLCRCHGITMDIVDGSRGRAWRKDRRIRIAPVKSEITYAVALHEIGHIVGRRASHRLEKEAAAWEWAKWASLDWTPALDRVMKVRLYSYHRWFERKQARGIHVVPSAAFVALLQSVAE